MSKTKSKLAAVVVSLPIVLVVFSGGPGCGSDPTRKVLDSSSFANAYAQALCTSLKHCCDENLVSYDYNECTKGWKADIERRFLLPNGNYDGRIANDCIAMIQAAQDKSCQPTQGSVSDARELCLSIFAGQKPLGTPCVASTECAAPPTGRAVCDTSPAGATDGGTLPLNVKILAQPVCTLVSPPAQGEPCALMPGQVGVANCGLELFCDPATLQCTTRALDGEACKTNGCAAGTYCATLAGGGRVCATFAPAGAPCNGPEQCDATTRCDLTGTKTCVFKKGPGEDCTNDVDCQIGTCDLTSKKCLKNGFATTAACNGRGP